jgi:PAS domain S-box-containing protein
LKLPRFLSSWLRPAPEPKPATPHADLHASEEKFRGVFDQSPLIMGLLEMPAGRFAEVNATALAAFGYRREEVLGRTTRELDLWADPADRERFLAAINAAGQLNADTRLRRRDGSVFPARCNGSLITIGDKRYALTAIQDLSAQEASELRRQAAEAALRESEVRFRTLFDRSPLLIALLSVPDGRILEANAATHAAFGYTPAETIGQTTHDLNLWADPAQRDHYLARLQTANHVTDFEARLRRKDGRIITVLFNASVVTLGEQRYTLNTLLDITARKQAEAALRESERHYRALVESVAHGYYVANARGFFTYCNPALYAMGGFDGKDLIGTSSFRVISEEDRGWVMAAYRTWRLDPAVQHVTCEFRVRAKSGRVFWVAQTTDFQRDSAGRVVNARNILHDITERKLAEQNLRESEARFNHALAATSDGIWDWTIATGDVYYSPQWCRLLGYEPAEVPARVEFFLQHVHPEDVPGVKHQIDEHLAGHSAVKESEIRLRLKSGAYRWFLDRGKIVARDDAGQAARMVGTISDITERKTAEEAMSRSLASLRATLESTADGILTIGADQRIESYNQQFVKMWRIPPGVLASRDDEQALGCVLEQLTNADAFIQKVRYLYSHPEEESFDTLSFRDGRVFERYSRPMFVAGRPSGRVWSFRDVTATQTAAAALRASEEKFRGVFDQSPVIMGLLTLPEGQFVEVNAAGLAAFGYSREESIGRTSVELGLWVEPADRMRYLDLLRTRGSVSGFETRMRRRNGEIFTVLYSGSVITIGGRTYSLNSLQDISDRIRAEQSLAASEQRYERVVSNISDALLVDDEAGHIQYANERARDLFGFGGGPLAGLTIEDYVAPEYREGLRERHERRIRGEAVPTQFDYEVLRPDGTRVWVEAKVTPVVVDGRITGTQSLNREITDRKLTEQALQMLSTDTAALQGAEFYSRIATGLAQLFGTEIGVIARYSDGREPRVRTLGLSVDGTNPPPVEYALAGTPCGAVRTQNMVIHRAGAGRLFPADHFLAGAGIEGYAAAALRDLSGQYLGHLAILSRRPLRHSQSVLESILSMVAVTVAAEIERLRAESKFRDLFAFAPDAILIVTQQGVITDANERALDLFGYSRAELTGRPTTDLMPADLRPALVERLRRYLTDPQPVAMGRAAPGLFALSKTGRRFPIDISLSPLRSDQGLLVVSAIRDISAQIRAAEQQQQIETQLRQAQKMEALGTLAGGIAHDFNNILTGMLGFVELTRLDLPASHPAQQWLNNLTISGDRAKNLVRQILTFSRKDTGERLPLRLSPVAEEALRLLRATIPPMITLRAQFATACPPILADSNQLHQVLINLVTNAWHAMPERHGTITVELAPCEFHSGSAAPLPGMPTGSYVRLSVADDGTGMDAHTRERIFDPFFTTKKTGEGTGLGLAVVHGIVESHGGFIKVQSTVGEGSRFDLYFPALAASPVVAAPSPLAGDIPAGRGEHCLLVDDDLGSAEVMGHLLDRLGYRVTTCHDPVQALARFRAAPREYAVVVTDLAMPGLTGIQLAREIRAVATDTPIMLVSGYVTPAQQQELRALGVQEVLRKPPTVAEIATALARSLGRP